MTRRAVLPASVDSTPERVIGISPLWGLSAAKPAGIAMEMAKFLSRYPDGAAGVALVLLRLACAYIAFAGIGDPPFPLSANASLVLSGVCALALSLGLGTRIVSFVIGTVAVAAVFTMGSDIALMWMARACACTALTLLGPGAYSIDANVFGRRVIRLEPRAPDRGSND